MAITFFRSKSLTTPRGGEGQPAALACGLRNTKAVRYNLTWFSNLWVHEREVRTNPHLGTCLEPAAATAVEGESARSDKSIEIYVHIWNWWGRLSGSCWDFVGFFSSRVFTTRGLCKKKKKVMKSPELGNVTMWWQDDFIPNPGGTGLAAMICESFMAGDWKWWKYSPGDCFMGETCRRRLNDTLCR